jgi:hypothetical protein
VSVGVTAVIRTPVSTGVKAATATDTGDAAAATGTKQAVATTVDAVVSGVERTASGLPIPLG